MVAVLCKKKYVVAVKNNAEAAALSQIGDSVKPVGSALSEIVSNTEDISRENENDVQYGPLEKLQVVFVQSKEAGGCWTTLSRVQASFNCFKI